MSAAGTPGLWLAASCFAMASQPAAAAAPSRAPAAVAAKHVAIVAGFATSPARSCSSSCSTTACQATLPRTAAAMRPQSVTAWPSTAAGGVPPSAIKPAAPSASSGFVSATTMRATASLAQVAMSLDSGTCAMAATRATKILSSASRFSATSGLYAMLPMARTPASCTLPSAGWRTSSRRSCCSTRSSSLTCSGLAYDSAESARRARALSAAAAS
mmetsp:Transcript_59618/g.167949  ORF Transcript_59618/g.167949 Transcript_59618/m.167949 type:complete len:215 (+) Transcript_59618:646-1290(+)